MKKFFSFLITFILLASFASAAHSLSSDTLMTVNVTSGEYVQFTFPLAGSFKFGTDFGSDGLINFNDAGQQEFVNVSNGGADLHWIGVLFQDSNGRLYSINEYNIDEYNILASANVSLSSIISSSGVVPDGASSVAEDIVSFFKGSSVSGLRPVGKTVGIVFDVSGKILFDSFVNGSFGQSFCHEFYPVSPELIGHTTGQLEPTLSAGSFIDVVSPDDVDETLTSAHLGKDFIVYGSCSSTVSGQKFFSLNNNPAIFGNADFTTVDIEVSVVDASDGTTLLNGFNVVVKGNGVAITKVSGAGGALGKAIFGVAPNQRYVVSVEKDGAFYGREILLDITTDWGFTFGVEEISSEDYTFSLNPGNWQVKDISFSKIDGDSIKFITEVNDQMVGKNLEDNIWLFKPAVDATGDITYLPGTVNSAVSTAELKLADESSWSTISLGPEMLSARPKDLFAMFVLKTEDYLQDNDPHEVFFWNETTQSVAKLNMADPSVDSSSVWEDTFREIGFEAGDVLFSAGSTGFNALGGTPDFFVPEDSIFFSNRDSSGNPSVDNVVVKVENIGTNYVGPLDVKVNIEGTEFTQTISEYSFTNDSINFAWSEPNSPKPYKICVIADPSGKVEEANITNNESCVLVVVTSTS